jgi:hypothetical protein
LTGLSSHAESCVCLCLLACRHIGGGAQERSRAVDVDYGGMHFQISQLDGVLEL